MENNGKWQGARLHPLEVIAPLVLLAILAVFALPNYVKFRPQADLRETLRRLQELVVTARHASLSATAAGVTFEPSASRARAWTGAEDGTQKPLGAPLELPGSIEFGYEAPIAPFPSLTLEDGTNLAATNDGITFENDTIVFRGGLLEGFPGLVYVRTSAGDHLALYVRISGEVQVHEWDGRRWAPRADFVAQAF